MLQLLWTTIKKFHKKLNICLLYESIISFLGIYPREIKHLTFKK